MMSAVGLSIIMMGLVAAAALLVAIACDTADAASSARQFQPANPVASGQRQPLRCRPKLLAKCPRDQKPACAEMSGVCCARFECRPKAR
jgi:hypothetical protein